MLFNSLEFVLFGAAFFAAWPLLRRWNGSRWTFLVVMSFIFYGWWDWRFLALIVGSGLIDFSAGLAMVRWPARRRLFLIASIIGNVGSLALFKYLDFLIGNVNWLGGLVGTEPMLTPMQLTLPVGISFYTFQSMSYTIDVYKGELTPTRNPLHFFAYLSMFPQLVAGPIVRAAHLLPQLERAVPTHEEQRWEGMQLILYGFFKKMVVADTLAPIINGAFASSFPETSSSYWWVIMVMFSFQIYCDFSGYSDIARGLAKWMGYDFPLNFDHPYISTSIREFWSRWHISLSTWFRDYVYIALGGSRGGRIASHSNMWITMLVSGLWHGAAWTFVIWGALHAAYLTLERETKWPERLSALPMGRFVAGAIVFVLALFAWVFFRAESFGQAWFVMVRLLDLSSFDLSGIRAVGMTPLVMVAVMAARQAWVYLRLSEHRWLATRPAIVTHRLALGLILAACLFLRGPGSAFIYFQF